MKLTKKDIRTRSLKHKDSFGCYPTLLSVIDFTLHDDNEVLPQTIVTFAVRNSVEDYFADNLEPMDRIQDAIIDQMLYIMFKK